MFKKIKSYAAVVWQLIIADLTAYSSSRYINELIDSLFWTATTLIISGKLLPSFGVRSDFGIFVAAGIPASRCLFQVYPRAINIVLDLMSNKALTYDLTLPIPSWLAIARIPLSSFIRSMMLSVFAFPFSLFFVWDQFNYTQFSFIKFSTILTMSALFCSAFGLIIASIVHDADELGSIWSRAILPLWSMGGFQFSFNVMLSKMPFFGYLSLLNPVIYMMEGMRVAILGQSDYLPFWQCVTALLIFTIIFSCIGIKKMLKRLDSV